MGVKDYTPLPTQTFYSDKPSVRLFADRFNSGRDYDALTGKRQVGLLDPKQAKISVKPEFANVESGAINVVLEQLVKGYNGSMTANLTDLNPVGLQIANGTNIDMVDVEPTSTVTGNTAATGSTATMLKMATGEATTFASHEGKVILVPRTNADSLPMRGIISRIDTVAEEIHLLYALDEVPKASAEVKLLEGFEQDIGGNVNRFREFIMAKDFLNGATHRVIIWRGQSVGGFDDSVTNDGAASMPIEIAILGHARTSAGAGNTTQIVPATIKGTYGKANV